MGREGRGERRGMEGGRGGRDGILLLYSLFVLLISWFEMTLKSMWRVDEGGWMREGG